MAKMGIESAVFFSRSPDRPLPDSNARYDAARQDIVDALRASMTITDWSAREEQARRIAQDAADIAQRYKAKKIAKAFTASARNTAKGHRHGY